MAPPPWRPSLEDYVDLAAFLLAASPDAVRRLPRMGSAESAINAPFASFGGQEPYPELLDQAAVLIAHLVQNHPLPDGNKRAAFLLTARSWMPTAGHGPSRTPSATRRSSSASRRATHRMRRSSRGSEDGPARIEPGARAPTRGARTPDGAAGDRNTRVCRRFTPRQAPSDPAVNCLMPAERTRFAHLLGRNGRIDGQIG